MKRLTSIAFALVLVGTTTVGNVVSAQRLEDVQDNRYLGDRFAFTVSGSIADLTSDVAAGRTLGGLINLEDLLGFDEQVATWGVGGLWRFSQSGRHSIRFSYADYTRDAYKAVSGTIPIFDVEFLGDVDSRFVNRFGTLFYEYSFTNLNKTEAGIGAGFGFYSYSLRLSGRYILDNDPNLEEFGSISESIIAPVPAVGFFINHALRPNLILDFSTRFITLSIGPHEGRIFSTVGDLTWYFTRHFGVGLGISSSDVVYENSGGDTRLKVDLRQNSLSLNGSFVF